MSPIEIYLDGLVSDFSELKILKETITSLAKLERIAGLREAGSIVNNYAGETPMPSNTFDHFMKVVDAIIARIAELEKKS